MKTKLKLIAIALALSAISHQLSTFAQGTAFTYQGWLNDGAKPASGFYDLQFTIYDSLSAGTQQGNSLTNSATAVSNGPFTVTLDFGNQFPGANRWLEIGVRTNGGAAFLTLSPRQPITPAPYSITAANLTPGSGLSGTYGSALTLSNAANQVAGTFTGQFAGGGGALTNLNASQLASGTVPDARLAGNVARTNQVWLSSGNPGTVPGANYLGTTDNQPLIFKVNNQQAQRFEPTTDTPNVVGGYSGNSVQAGLEGVTIGGGGTVVGNQPNSVANNGHFATIAGGYQNTVTNYGGAILGGAGNYNGGNYATLGAGISNTNLSDYAVVVGGANNTIQTASSRAAIIGGQLNTVQINSPYSSIVGGYDNTVQPYSLVNTVGGGAYNLIQGNSNYWFIGQPVGSTIAGGAQNSVLADGHYGTIGGGALNVIQSNVAASTIGGGFLNTNTGDYATIPGGVLNIATTLAFAAGNQARATNQGSFVWADSQNAPFGSTTNDQFLARAQGGLKFVTTGAGMALDGGKLSAVDSGPGNQQFWFVEGARSAAASNNVVLRVVPYNALGVGYIDAYSTDLSHPTNLLFNPNGGNVGVGTYAPTNKLHVVGGATITGDIVNPKFKVTQVFNSAGPLPLTNSLAVGGGTLVINIVGSAYTTTANSIMGIDLGFNNVSVSSSKLFANSALQHMALVPGQAVLTGVPAGTYTLSLRAFIGTTADASDNFSVTVMELPF